jgi:hypothetical protein
VGDRKTEKERLSKQKVGVIKDIRERKKKYIYIYRERERERESKELDRDILTRY